MVNKLVWITGASKGIGMNTARHLALNEDYKLVLFSRNNDLISTAQQIGKSGIMCEPINLDITKRDEVYAKAEQAINAYGVPDVVINNAGSNGGGKRFEELTPDEIDGLVDVNLKGHIHLTRAVLPHMQKRGNGHLVYVSSISALTGAPGHAVYAPAKSGLETFARTLKMENPKLRFTVIRPALVDTTFFEGYGPAFRDKQGGRMIRPYEVATVIGESISRPIEGMIDVPYFSAKALKIIDWFSPSLASRLVVLGS